MHLDLLIYVAYCMDIHIIWSYTILATTETCLIII